MKKVALVFVVAVIAPSLVLAWMAGRSLRDQTYVLDRQQTLLYQNLADTQARAVAEHLEKAQRSFAYLVEGLLKGASPSNVASSFDPVLRQRWPLAEVGFAVDLNGLVLAPSLLASSQARKFRAENDRFLCSFESCEIYWNSPKGPISLTTLDLKEAALSAGRDPKTDAKTSSGTAPDEGIKAYKAERTVMPAKEAAGDTGYSKLSSGEVNFRNLIGQETDGTFSRFLQDKLHVMIWHRAVEDARIIFGAQLNVAKLTEELRGYLGLLGDLRAEVCLALLDDTGKPVVLSHASFQPSAADPFPQRPGGRPLHPRVAPRFPVNRIDNVPAELSAVPRPVPTASSLRRAWKHPFVSAEIGEALPHWEVAVYLLDPSKLANSASTIHLTLGLLLALLLLAIAVGSWLIVADLRRQLRLARQKTDFVSNVSHELKTPLTSIRMFSEMLAEDRVHDEAKRAQFLKIITAEASRLTRLINNVLDFARLERGEKTFRLESCDATALVRETVELYRPHLEASGFSLQVELPPSPALLRADRDALAQVLVNLLSNAEKYSGEGKEILVQVQASGGRLQIRVLDRGLGVPRGAEEKIFEQFHRAHDSLASGVQGSGLGLTLARHIARQHGGDVRYEPREGGGSCFVVDLPL